MNFVIGKGWKCRVRALISRNGLRLAAQNLKPQVRLGFGSKGLSFVVPISRTPKDLVVGTVNPPSKVGWGQSASLEDIERQRFHPVPRDDRPHFEEGCDRSNFGAVFELNPARCESAQDASARYIDIERFGWPQMPISQRFSLILHDLVVVHRSCRRAQPSNRQWRQDPNSTNRHAGAPTLDWASDLVSPPPTSSKAMRSAFSRARKYVRAGTTISIPLLPSSAVRQRFIAIREAK